MKRIVFAISFVLTTLLSFAQAPFEGKVIYHNTIKSKIPSVSDEKFASMMGTTWNYYIKGGQYKNESNGLTIQSQTYINADNKIYTKVAGSPALFWNDGAVNQDEVLSTVLHKDAATISGYTCDELVLICKSGIQKYYYSKKLPVNSKLFTRHRFGNWYAYLSKAHALPLKTIIDNKQFTLESVATAVAPMKLNATLFTLPVGVKTMPMPVGR